MNDEVPKDYSRLYIEERPPPIPPLTRATKLSHKHKLGPLQMDGAIQPLKHRETIDLKEVCLKLNNHISQVKSHANEALSQHYTNFVEAKNPQYRVLIKYPKINDQPEDNYAIRVHVNTLRAVKDKLPRRGNFRYFFRTSNCLEEVESDDSPVPIYSERDGQKQIHVHLYHK